MATPLKQKKLYMVRPKGLEPSRDTSHNDLNVTRLPIPPWPPDTYKAANRDILQIKNNQAFFNYVKTFFISVSLLDNFDKKSLVLTVNI